MRITHITLLVDEIDRALSFYIDVLGFEVRADDRHDTGFRYTTIAPSGDGPELWLLPASTEQQHARIGNQTADVTLVITTDDCHDDYQRMCEAGVVFHGEPENVAWGLETVFEDLYGNRFALLEPAR